MKLTINKNKITLNPAQLLREAGYAYNGEKDGEHNFVRPLAARSQYPQFHIYTKTEGDLYVFNLHLDQKKPSYGGSSAHSGEYEGPVVAGEIENLKRVALQNLARPIAQAEVQKEEKKGWLRRMLGI